jgi:hypothetical protein
MPKVIKFNESPMTRACEAAQAQAKPNISKIAREYGVPYGTLHDRVKKGSQPCAARKPVNKALQGHQEEALIHWIAYNHDINMLVMPRLLEDYVNQAL